MQSTGRYRAKLTALRTSAKAQIHAVMAKLGILPPLAEMFGPAGQIALDEMPFEGAYATRVESLRDLLRLYDRELTMVDEAGDAGVGVEPLRRGEQAKRPLGLAEGYGQVGDRLQRRGGPDPVAVVVQDRPLKPVAITSSRSTRAGEEDPGERVEHDRRRRRAGSSGHSWARRRTQLPSDPTPIVVDDSVFTPVVCEVIDLVKKVFGTVGDLRDGHTGR